MKNRHRRSTRLPEYDYSQPGMYFLTFPTKNRECLFGEIKNGKMILNNYGKIAKKWWQDLKNRFPGVNLDVSIVMPNHLHGIIEITVGVIHKPVGAKFIPPASPCSHGGQGIAPTGWNKPSPNVITENRGLFQDEFRQTD